MRCHEHLDSLGIVHMNGRIYDPRLARFLQADPLIEDGSTLNRYTYVHNDPLAWTDPSGYWGRREQRALRTIVAVAISVWSGGALSGAPWAGVNASSWSLGAKLAFAAASGAAAGGIQSGTVEGAAWGAFSAGVFFGIGQAIQGAGLGGNFLGSKLSPTGFAVKTVSHGLAGGTISHLQGGKFGHGFVSAAGSAATAPLVDASSANVVRGAVVTTLVGGTLSRISGGKFANGALTAAMSYAFNKVASSDAEVLSGRSADTDDVFGNEFEGLRPGVDYVYRFNVAEAEFIAYSANGVVDWIQFDAYSGAPGAVNDVARMAERNVGPIPSGLYSTSVDRNANNARLGPLRVRLEPISPGQTHGRSGFLIHADSVRAPGTASRGCIILPRHARSDVIGNLGRLYVAPHR